MGISVINLINTYNALFVCLINIPDTTGLNTTALLIFFSEIKSGIRYYRTCISMAAFRAQPIKYTMQSNFAFTRHCSGFISIIIRKKNAEKKSRV